MLLDWVGVSHDAVADEANGVGLILILNEVIASMTVHSFSSTLCLFTVSLSRVLRLLLIVLLDTLKDTIHLLLEEKLELVDHELVDGASLNKVGDKAFDSVTLVDNDAFYAKVGYVDVNVKLGLTLVSASVVLVILAHHLDVLDVVLTNGRRSCCLVSNQTNLLIVCLLNLFSGLVALNLVLS